MTEPSIRVLIADDQRVVREGLSMLVGLIEGVEVVGTASRRHRGRRSGSGRETRCGADGPANAEHGRRRGNHAGSAPHFPRRKCSCSPPTPTTSRCSPPFRPARAATSRKTRAPRRSSRRSSAVAAGRTHLDPAVQQRLIAAVLDPQPVAAAVRPLPDDLTPREAETLKLIAAGLSNAEIAKTLVVSDATVKTHINRVFRKTGVRDRAQAVRYAYEHGIT